MTPAKFFRNMFLGLAFMNFVVGNLAFGCILGTVATILDANIEDDSDE
jgi:hypothetical protein